MNPLLWVLVGAAGYLALATIAAAVVDIETREALTRVVLTPAVMLLTPLVWLAMRVPVAGRFQLGNLRRELDAHHHLARGVAWHTWCIVFLRRTGPKPPAPERVP